MRSPNPSAVVRFGLLALAGIVATAAGLIHATSDTSPPPARISLAAAKRGTVTSTVSAAGSTVDAHTRDLAFGADGTVQKIYVKVGDKVDKGQILARIDDTAAREQYDAAKANLAAAEETLANIQNGTSSSRTSSSGTSGSGGSSTSSGAGRSVATGAGRGAGQAAGQGASAAPSPPHTRPSSSSDGRPATAPTPGASPANTCSPARSATASPPASGQVEPAPGTMRIEPAAYRLGAYPSAPAASPGSASSAAPGPAPTVTVTRTVTATPKPTGAPTRTPTPVPTPAPTPRPTAAGPTATVTVTATPTATVTVTVRPTVTVTVRPTATVTVTTAPTGTGPRPSTSASGRPHPSASASRPAGGSTGPGGGPSHDARPSTSADAAPPSACPSPTAGGTAGAGKAGTGKNGTGKNGAGDAGGEQAKGRQPRVGRTGTGSVGRAGGFGAAGDGRGRAVTEAEAEADVTQAKDDLEAARQALKGVVITAPADGTVLSIAGTVGTQVRAGSASGFIRLGDLDELQVKGLFTQSDVGSLRIGQRAVVTLATRPGEQYTGTITHIDPTATTTGRLVQYGVLVAFDRHPAGLLLGQNASITVTTGKAEAALYVPARAVRLQGDGVGVVTVERDGRRLERQVTTGIRGERFIEIVAGLREGDQVVLPGQGGTSSGFPEEGFPGLPTAAPSPPPA